MPIKLRGRGHTQPEAAKGASPDRKRRLLECRRLRVKDVAFDYRQILVRDGKGAKDRVTVLPESAIEPLRARREKPAGSGGAAACRLPALRTKRGSLALRQCAFG